MTDALIIYWICMAAKNRRGGGPASDRPACRLHDYKPERLHDNRPVCPLPENGHSHAGFSVVELLIALTLMAFLATSLLTIITAGGGAFQRVLDDKSAQGEARIAISYITVKLRQHSARGKVSIVPSDSLTNARDVLKIEGGSGGGLLGEHYYIYFEETEDGGAGRLVEKTASAPHVGDPAGAFKIAEISDFHISYADETQSVINIVIVCDTPGEARVAREVSIALRAS